MDKYNGNYVVNQQSSFNNRQIISPIKGDIFLPHPSDFKTGNLRTASTNKETLRLLARSKDFSTEIADPLSTELKKQDTY